MPVKQDIIMPKPEEISAARLCLGTVQLGQSYGFAALVKARTSSCSDGLLDRAIELGVRQFDTARAYGPAEELIGNWLRQSDVIPSDLKIISKIPKSTDVDDAALPHWVDTCLQTSAQHLGQYLNGYLLHHPTDLERPALWKCLQRARARGAFAAIGASIYEAEHLVAACALDDLDLVQLPINLGRRTAAWDRALEIATEAGLGLYGRGVFLQGLLLADPCNLPPDFAPAQNFLVRFHGICADANTRPSDLCVAAALKRLGKGGRVVLGADSRQQLDGLLPCYTVPDQLVTDAEDLAEKYLPVEFRDPRTWPRQNRG